MFSCLFGDYILQKVLKYPPSVYYSKGCNRHELNMLIYVINEEYKIKNKNAGLLVEEFVFNEGIFKLPSVDERYSAIGFGNIPEPLGYINLFLKPQEEHLLTEIIKEVSLLDYFQLIQRYSVYEKINKK